MHSLVQKILGTCERVANIFLHPGANYTYMHNLHTVCKSAHVNGTLTAVSRVNFLFSFFHKKDISWVIIRIEIKMKSSASRLGDKFDRSMTLGKLLGNNALLFIFIS